MRAYSTILFIPISLILAHVPAVQIDAPFEKPLNLLAGAECLKFCEWVKETLNLSKVDCTASCSQADKEKSQTINDIATPKDTQPSKGVVETPQGTTPVVPASALAPGVQASEPTVPASGIQNPKPLDTPSGRFSTPLELPKDENGQIKLLRKTGSGITPDQVPNFRAALGSNPGTTPAVNPATPAQNAAAPAANAVTPAQNAAAPAANAAVPAQNAAAPAANAATPIQNAAAPAQSPVAIADSASTPAVTPGASPQGAQTDPKPATTPPATTPPATAPPATTPPATTPPATTPPATAPPATTPPATTPPATAPPATTPENKDGKKNGNHGFGLAPSVLAVTTIALAATFFN